MTSSASTLTCQLMENNNDGHFMSLQRVAPMAAAVMLGLLAGCQPQTQPAPPAPAPEVLVTSVVQRDEPIPSEWIGTLAGFVDSDIRAEVSGYLLRQDYREGARVKKGDLLFEIDPRPFQAALDQAKATYHKAQLDLARAKALIASDAVAREQYDDAIAAEEGGRAALEQAELNLGFTRIVAPTDGIAGIATAQVGDLVGPSSGVLASVSQVDPIKVYFPISEQDYLDLARAQDAGGNGFRSLRLQLILADGSAYDRPGSFFAVDRQVDPSTGTIRLAATFSNPDYLLRPGEFARVRAVTRTLEGALEVPQKAVNELQGAYQVGVVAPGNRVRLTPVQLGQQVGTRWIVKQGLKAGETVIVDGLQKVRDGTTVDPHPATTE
jgi:membrane fusion protein (multidrug efflux system)